MFDHLPVGLYRTTPQGDFLDANPALIRMLGYPDRNQLQNSFARDLYVSPEDRPEFLNLLESHGVARGFESKIQRLDGETIRVLNTARVHRNADGDVLYMEGSLEDITSLQSAEASHGSEARFRAIFDNSRIAIAMLDLDALVDEANPTFHEVFGATESQIKGIPYPELLMQDEQSQMLQDLAVLSRGDRDRDQIVGERRYQGPEGAVIWARTMLRLVRDPGGKPDHLLLLLDDLSEGEAG